MISRTLLLLYGARKMNHGYVKRLQVDVNQLFFSFVPPFSRSRLQLTAVVVYNKRIYIWEWRDSFFSARICASIHVVQVFHVLVQLHLLGVVVQLHKAHG